MRTSISQENGEEVTITNEQLSAMAARMQGDVTVSRVRAALEAAEEALVQGMLPIFAANAAAAVLYPLFADMPVADRAALMVDVVNGLWSADGVQRLGPVGFLTIDVVRT
jgi:hypothetical protein